MESTYKKRGKLTIYLGYRPGVGKTYEMLSNGIDPVSYTHLTLPTTSRV
ncbi:hypothetical protein JMUB7532_27310 [Staphylococcus aureus]